MKWKYIAWILPIAILWGIPTILITGKEGFAMDKKKEVRYSGEDHIAFGVTGPSDSESRVVSLRWVRTKTGKKLQMLKFGFSPVGVSERTGNDVRYQTLYWEDVPTVEE